MLEPIGGKSLTNPETRGESLNIDAAIPVFAAAGVACYLANTGA